MDRAANRKTKAPWEADLPATILDLYNGRNTVERLINKLKAWRGIVTRYDKTPPSYFASLRRRASMIWVKDRTGMPC